MPVLTLKLNVRYMCNLCIVYSSIYFLCRQINDKLIHDVYLLIN